MPARAHPDAGFFVSSPVGRGLLSVLLLFTLSGVFVWNLPPSHLRHRLIPVYRPYVHALGLDQDWGLFSPDPRNLSILFEARLGFRDGSGETFHPPLGDPFVGLFRGYRWKKWGERVRRDSHRRHWEPTARHFAHRYTDDPRGLTSVVLVRRWSVSPEIGSVERTWNEYEFFTLELDAAGAADE